MRMKRLAALMMVCAVAASAMTGCKGKYAASNQTAATAAEGSSAAEGSEAAEETKVPKDTLQVAIIQDMVTMDPQETNLATNWAVQRQMYNHLVHENPDGTVDPELATEWEFLDDLTLRMKLRDDVYFHNGNHFTAEDVLFMIQRAKQTSISASTFESFDAENTKIVDDYTIDIKFNKPYAAVFNTFSSGRGSVVSKQYVEEVGAVEAAIKPVGTGPYKFVKIGRAHV